MKNLTYPEIDNKSLWDAIVSRKHKVSRSKLKSVREKVMSRYDFYESHIDSLDNIVPLVPEEWGDAKETLMSCYGQNVEFKKVRKIIMDSLSATNRTKCPYCMLNRPNTIDHFFDKNDYPEFSVYIPNLIPCCSECNTQKGTSMFDRCNNREYIHFYYDKIPEDQFIFVRLSYLDGGVPFVNIELIFKQEDYASKLIRRHFVSLSLIIKYRDVILERLAPVLEEIEMMLNVGIFPDIIKETLRIRYDSLVKCYGKNYWETCMYEGILNSPTFLEQILSV